MLKALEPVSKYSCHIIVNASKTFQSTGRARCYSKDFNVMSKFLNKGKKRNAWHTNPDRPATLPLPTSIAKGPQSNKRVVVLNKLFMKHITDLMATGKGSEELSGLGVEVTKVKVGSEFNVVNVYWVSTGSSTEEKVEAILKNTARYLRHELSNLRVMGKVPEIQFVRDRSVTSWAAVEAILATADFGEDYEPKGINTFKNEFDQEPVSEDALNEEFPPMRQNVLGLNRAAILDRLTAAMKGKQMLPIQHRKSPKGTPLYEPFDEEAFSQFLLKQKIEKDRIMKESRREPKLDEFYEYEDSSSQAYEEEDYIVDNDDDTSHNR